MTKLDHIYLSCLSMTESTKDSSTKWSHPSTNAGTSPQWLVNSEGNVDFSGTRSIVKYVTKA